VRCARPVDHCGSPGKLGVAMPPKELQETFAARRQTYNVRSSPSVPDFFTMYFWWSIMFAGRREARPPADPDPGAAGGRPFEPADGTLGASGPVVNAQSLQDGAAAADGRSDQSTWEDRGSSRLESEAAATQSNAVVDSQDQYSGLTHRPVNAQRHVADARQRRVVDLLCPAGVGRNTDGMLWTATCCGIVMPSSSMLEETEQASSRMVRDAQGRSDLQASDDGRKRRIACLILTLTTLVACARTAVPTPAILKIERIQSTTDQVHPGQRGVVVTARVLNWSSTPLQLLRFEMLFTQAGVDVSADYTVQPSAANPSLIAASAGADLRLWVDVAPAALTGIIEMNARAQALDPDGNVIETTGSQETDTWEVLEIPAIVVTTADDEDDIQQNTPSIAAAGGAADLSLREAMLIANSMTTPVSVQFDAAVFPQNLPVTIFLSAILGDLPAIANAGLEIDGTGAGVALDVRDRAASGITRGFLIQSSADDFALRHITMWPLVANSTYDAIKSDHADRVSVIDCAFVDAGSAATRAQIELLGGRGHVVRRSTFANYSIFGILLAEDPYDVTLEENEFSGSSLSVTASGLTHRIVANRFRQVGLQGITVSGVSTSDVLIQANIFEEAMHLNDGVGIRVRGGAHDIRIEGNRFDAIKIQDVHILDAGTNRVTVTQNSHSRTNDIPVRVDDGANDGLLPPAITAFDGVQVRGTAGLSTGDVEVYGGGGHWDYLGSTSVVGGVWAFVPSTPQIAVLALLLAPGGGTSGASSIARQDNGQLVVTTLDDELDGGDTSTTVDEVGGANDLSLREAMVIANNRAGPDTIIFDNTVFPPGVEKTIGLAAGWAQPSPLPPITDRYTTIDGGNAHVVLDGADVFFPSGPLLLVSADNVSIKNLEIRNYHPTGAGECVYAYMQRDLEVSHCTFVNCNETNNGNAVTLYYPQRTYISDNRIQLCGNGIYVQGGGSLDVADNRITQCNLSGIAAELANGGLTIRDNVIDQCGFAGIFLQAGTHRALSIGNVLWDNSTGIYVHGDADQQEVYFSTLMGNGVGIELLGNVMDLVLRDNLFAQNQTYGIELTSSVELLADHQLFFDNGGDGTSGTSAYSLAGRLQSTDVLADPQLTSPSLGNFAPRANAIDSGLDIGYDRNGSLPGLFNGIAPDIGAIETGP
jgi:hypothetical protein